jgi:hypothetical protein
MVIAGVLSVIGGVALVGIVAIALRKVNAGKKRALVVAGLLPTFGFAYLFVCILVFSIWSSMRGRDWGWGDTWDTPIVDDYHLMMIDVMDNGTIYNRADPSVYRDGSVAGSSRRRDVIFGVRRLEVRSPYLIGTASPDTSMEYPVRSPEKLFFILDTRNGSRTDEPSLAALQQAVEKSSGPLRLESVEAVYGRLRYDSLDLVPVIVLGVPPVAAFGFLFWVLLKLRASGKSVVLHEI